MGQNGSKELAANRRRRRSQRYWDSLKSSSTTSWCSVEECATCPALTRRTANLAVGGHPEKPLPGKIDKVLNYCKRKISRKESCSTAHTRTFSTDITDCGSISSGMQPAVKGLDQLVSCTKFSREELQQMYRGFKNDCPAGVVDWDTFKKIYAELFPCGDSSLYASFIFNTFDLNKNGKITFENFAIGLSKSMHGSLDEKLKWTFQLYDLDDDGVLTKEELIEVLDAVYRMTAVQVTAKSPDIAVCIWGDPEMEEKVGEIFKAIDQDGDGVVNEAEFIRACRQDKSLLRSLAIANQFDSMDDGDPDSRMRLVYSDSAKSSSRRKYSEHVNRQFRHRELHRRGSLPNLQYVGECSHTKRSELDLSELVQGMQSSAID